MRNRSTLTVIGILLCVFCLIGVFPLFAEGALEQMKADGVFISSKISRVFPGTLDSVYTLTTWERLGEADVPYVSVKEYLRYLYAQSYNPEISFSWDGDVLLVTRNGEDIRLDLNAQTISCGDYRAFEGSHAAGQMPAGVLEKEEFICIRPSVKNSSSATPSKGYDVHLKDYGLEMFRKDDDILMPFAAMQNIFASATCNKVLAYNGEDYFDIVNCVESIYGSESMAYAPNPYANKWYSGPFAGRGNLGDAYARYYYGTTCLLLDLIFGHKEEMGISSFDVYFEENGIKNALLTPEPEDDKAALQKMFDLLFDSGHDAEVLTPSIINSEGAIGRAELLHMLLDLIGYNSLADVVNEWEPVVMELLKLAQSVVNSFISEDEDKVDFFSPLTDLDSMGPKTQQLVNDIMRLSFLKPYGYGKNRVDIVGDTGIIYFESFLEDLVREESYYTKIPYKNDIDKSTFALFYYAFEQFGKDGNVRNVVIDLTNNGGGHVGALISALGFLSPDGEVNFSYQDLVNGSFCSEYYHVDTNLDGVFDDADGYGGEYNFYILTSSYSYSCGTALPYFAQRDGLATIIGAGPGGGDCAVAYYLDAYGHVGMISGFLKIGTYKDGSFVSDESAVRIEKPLTEEDQARVFFHPEEIARLVSGAR